MPPERRSFRLPFSATAEVAPAASPSATAAARVAELSLLGCYLQTPAPFPVDTLLMVKIFHDDQYFESKAKVLYIKSDAGMGVAFQDIKPYCQAALQKWILSALRQTPPNFA